MGRQRAFAQQHFCCSCYTPDSLGSSDFFHTIACELCILLVTQ